MVWSPLLGSVGKGTLLAKETANCYPCVDPRILSGGGGGGGVQVNLKSSDVFFFSPQLILRKSMTHLNENNGTKYIIQVYL